MKPAGQGSRLAALGIMLALGLTDSLAGTVTLPAVADTTLSENYSSNNFGALTFVNAGTTQNQTRNRGLFRFAPADALPPGARITQANLVLEVRHTPSGGYAFADFTLHRLLRDWGEGRGTSPVSGNTPGAGSPALIGEATWQSPFALTPALWAAPGALATNDYVPFPSSSQTIYGLNDSPYTFATTVRLVADVQDWLDQPAANFGWILICEAEATPFTARRFASHEDPNYGPQLQVDYLIPPVIDGLTRTGNHLEIHFQAQADQSYDLRFARDPAGQNDWSTLAKLPPAGVSGPVVFTANIDGATGFFRLQTY